jgi:hypothetical protein
LFHLGAVQRMISIEPTEDYEVLRSILFHPQVFHFRSVPDSIKPEEYHFPDGLYLLARSGITPVGYFYFSLQNPILYQVHTAFLPSSWGYQTVLAARAGIAWLALHTECEVLLALIPSFNRSALSFMERLGAHCHGSVPRAIKKEGVRVPEMIYTLEVTL